MLLSVILPTFNGARFLGAQIDSILAQTIEDFELLVIDDGSTDHTAAIVEEFARRDSRVRVVPSTGNRGQRRRIVELLAAASGEFVAIADQDDIWHRDRNARLLAAIGDMALACGRSQLVDADGNDLGISILEAKGVDAQRVGRLAALFQPLVSAHAAIMRRAWVDIGALMGSLPFDMALGLDASFSAGLIYVDEAVVHHRLHDNNQMNGSVLPSFSKLRLASRHRARKISAMIRSRRVVLYQRLDHLGRSMALEPSVRAIFRHLADTCWSIWFGMGGRADWLESEFHRCLASYVELDNDIMFRERVRWVTQPWWTPANLATAWQVYIGGPVD